MRQPRPELGCCYIKISKYGTNNLLLNFKLLLFLKTFIDAEFLPLKEAT
jgi:hypothetical protein